MEEEHTISFLDDIIERTACNGEAVYIYSLEQKARAVALVSVLVGILYSLPAKDALGYVCSCMGCPASVLAPCQWEQVQRLLTEKRGEFCYYQNLSFDDRMMVRTLDDTRTNHTNETSCASTKCENHSSATDHASEGSDDSSTSNSSAE